MSMAKFKYIITNEEEGLPLKKIIPAKFAFSSRLMSVLKRQGLIRLNGIPAPGWVPTEAGDMITICLPEEKSDFPPEDIPIRPVYEDDDLLILDKQPGVTIHPTKGRPLHTLANGIMKYMEDTGQSFKIRFINRLDMGTSGLIAIAKNSYAQYIFIKQMKAGIVKKHYIALVKGIVTNDDFTVNLPIGRPSPDDPRRGVMAGGHSAVTHVHVVRRFPVDGGHTLVAILLGTGRTHQIRVHMTYLGHPLVGDRLYGGMDPGLMPRQALHACKLSFEHPITHKPVTVEAPLPPDMEEAIEKLRSRAAVGQGLP